MKLESPSQSVFHVDPAPEIFFCILLPPHFRASLEMVWPSHTPKSFWFLYWLVNFPRKNFPLYMFEIGKILMYNTMYVLMQSLTVSGK